MTDEQALDNITSTDEQKARQAFDYLTTKYRDLLLRVLRQAMSSADADEMLQEAFSKHWVKRHQFVNRGINSWLRYIKRAANNAYCDKRRKEKPEKITPLEEGQMSPDGIDILTDIYLEILTGRLFYCADALWLSLDLSIPPPVLERRILAANLYYFENLEIAEIVGILKSAPINHRAESDLTSGKVREWLHAPDVIRKLAYDTLYINNTDLYDHFVQLPDLTPEELVIARWHFRVGLMPSEIIAKLGAGAPNKDSIIELVERLCLRLPYETRIKELISSLKRKYPGDVHRLLKESDLWKRLAFQYYYRDELSPSCIVERISVATHHVGLSISEATVNMWTHGHRLTDNLIKYWRQNFQE